MTDLTGSVCLRCKQGQLEERCLQDDWDGTLTCGYCGAQEHRWSVGRIDHEVEFEVDLLSAGLDTALYYYTRLWNETERLREENERLKAMLNI